MALRFLFFVVTVSKTKEKMRNFFQSDLRKKKQPPELKINKSVICNRRTKIRCGEDLEHRSEEYSQCKTEHITCLLSERDKKVMSFFCMEK